MYTGSVMQSLELCYMYMVCHLKLIIGIILQLKLFIERIPAELSEHVYQHLWHPSVGQCLSEET